MSSSNTLPPAVAAVASDSAPKPITPAAATAQPPAAALDPLTTTEGSFLEQAKQTILPVVEKVQATAKPYTDAAAQKAQELVQKIEGTHPTQAGAGAREVPGTSATSATGTTGITGSAGETAKSIFAQVTTAVSGAIHQVTNTIETRTTTDSHPGLVTQAQNLVKQGQDKLDSFLDAPVTGTSAHPVQTTTNTVPHPVAPVDPTVPVIKQ